MRQPVRRQQLTQLKTLLIWLRERQQFHTLLKNLLRGQEQQLHKQLKTPLIQWAQQV